MLLNARLDEHTLSRVYVLSIDSNGGKRPTDVTLRLRALVGRQTSA